MILCAWHRVVSLTREGDTSPQCWSRKGLVVFFGYAKELGTFVLRFGSRIALLRCTTPSGVLKSAFSRGPRAIGIC